MNSINQLITLNRVKLGRAVTFMKYLTSVVSFIFLPKKIFWNKIRFRLSNSLNLAELLVNEVTKSISKKTPPNILFLSDLPLRIVKISGAYN